MIVTPYLTFPGTTHEAFSFYAELFGGQIEVAETVRNSAVAGEMPEKVQDLILHARVRIGDGHLMASDDLSGTYQKPEGVTLQTSFNDVEKAKRIFSRLSKNGEIVMPFERTFWSAGFGICRDRFDVLWMVNCDAPFE